MYEKDLLQMNNPKLKEFQDELENIISLGCPMSCSIKDIFEDFMKCGDNNINYGVFSSVRTKQSALQFLKYFTKKYDDLLYNYVINKNIHKFRLRWNNIMKL